MNKKTMRGATKEPMERDISGMRISKQLHQDLVDLCAEYGTIANAARQCIQVGADVLKKRTTQPPTMKELQELVRKEMEAKNIKELVRKEMEALINGQTRTKR